jgi:hypothetical protein
MTTILTSDNVVFNLHRDFVEDAKLLKNFTEEFENDCVTLSNIDSSTFLKVHYFFVHGRLVEYDSVKSVIVAADYMHYEKLIDHCAEYIATKVIKGLSPQQIKKYFENI